jgi:hypothetical protein
VILETLRVEKRQFEERTGWSLKPEGACKGNVCVPMPEVAGELLDVRDMAERLNMPLVRHENGGLWCLGPEAMGRALTTAQAMELVLPDAEGKEFRLSSLRGEKVALVAWASW